MLYSNGVIIVDYIQGQGPKLMLNSLPAIKTLQFLSYLVFVDKVVKFEGRGSTSPPTYANGKAAMWIEAGQAYNIHNLNAGLKSYIAPLPMGPDVNHYQNFALVNCRAILSTCEIPREVAHIMEKVCTIWDENLNPDPVYQEVLSKLPYDWAWTRPGASISTEQEYRLSLQQLYPYFKPDYINGFPNLSNKFRDVIARPIFQGTMSVMQAIDSGSDVLNQIIDEYR